MPVSKFNLQIWILTLGVAILSGTAGFAYWKISQMKPQPASTTMIVLPEPRPLNEFELTDHHGNPFSPANVRDQWTLMFFGFTHCPDVCPTALYELQQVKSQLSEDDGSRQVTPQVVFVSVDPERDTPEKMAQYLSHFDDEFLGVTGTHEQLLPLTRKIGIAYRIEEHEPGAPYYSVDHSSGIMLVNPDGQLHAVLPTPHLAEQMASELQRVLENS